MVLFDGFGTTALSVLQAMLPLLALFVVFQALFLRLPAEQAYNILTGALLAGAGLLLFLQGVNAGLLPYGRAIGEALGALAYRWVLIPFGFALGFVTAWSEPAVRVLSHQVEEESAGSIRGMTVVYAVCMGVAFFVALGMARIVYSFPLLYILVPGYCIVLVMLWFSEKEFLAVAFDAGGVATGPMSNTFLLALGLGVSSSGGSDPAVYGLGLVSLIALAPVVSVMALGFILRGAVHQEEVK